MGIEPITRTSVGTTLSRQRNFYRLRVFQPGGLFLVCPLLPANPVNHTPKKAVGEAVFSPVGFLFREEGAPLPAQILAGQRRSAELHELRFCLSHFASLHTSSKQSGPRAAPTASCGDAPL